MSFPRILPFAAVLLACNAMAGFYATAALAALLEALPVSETCVDDMAPDPAPIGTWSGSQLGFPAPSSPAESPTEGRR